MNGLSYNVDSHEVQKFSNLAADWWDLNGSCAPLHIINPVRLQFIMQHCHLNGLEVLDIGCGAGILSEALTRQGAKVTAIDASSELIAAARQHALSMQLDIEYKDIYTTDLLQQSPKKFDVVVCMELLEHVPDPILLLQECQQFLKPNGKLFLATLNRNPKSYALAILAAEYILKLLPQQTHDYGKLIRPSELAEFLQQANFKLQDLAGMQFQPFTKTAHLSNDVSVNYLAYATKKL